MSLPLYTFLPFPLALNIIANVLLIAARATCIPRSSSAAIWTADLLRELYFAWLHRRWLKRRNLCPRCCCRQGVPVPAVVRHGISDNQMKGGAEKITGAINKLLGVPSRCFPFA